MIIHIGKVSIKAFEAHTAEEQSIGLSHLSELPDGHGMLFVYPNVASRTFWMPDTMKFPIDIMFIDNDATVSRIYKCCTPGSKFRFTGQGKWTLEVPAGFCKRNGIQVGDRVEFNEESNEVNVEGGAGAGNSSDRLRGLTTADSNMSTETAPYSRAPSVKPKTPNEDRFRQNQIPAEWAEGADSDHFDQAIGRDPAVEWNSPTRHAKLFKRV